SLSAQSSNGPAMHCWSSLCASRIGAFGQLRRGSRADRRAANDLRHPEYHWTSGVETTTGSLGQGLATSGDMALAWGWAAAMFKWPGFPMFDFNVYALLTRKDATMNLVATSYQAKFTSGPQGRPTP